MWHGFLGETDMVELPAWGALVLLLWLSLPRVLQDGATPSLVLLNEMDGMIPSDSLPLQPTSELVCGMAELVHKSDTIPAGRPVRYVQHREDGRAERAASRNSVRFMDQISHATHKLAGGLDR